MAPPALGAKPGPTQPPAVSHLGKVYKAHPLQGTPLKTVVLKVGVPKVGVFGNVRRHSWLSQFGGQRVLLASNGPSPGLLNVLELHKMAPATENFLPQMLRNPTC